MNDSSNGIECTSDEALSNKPTEVQPPATLAKFNEILEEFSKWVAHAFKISSLLGSGLVFGYLLMTGYTPVDNIAGIGAIAAFVAGIALLLIFSYVALWAMPSFVLNQFLSGANKAALSAPLSMHKDDQIQPSPGKVFLYSIGTIFSTGAIFWSMALSTFFGVCLIPSLVAGITLWSITAYLYATYRADSDNKEINNNQKDATHQKTKILLHLAISATSLPASLPITNLLERSSLLEGSTDSQRIAALFGSLFMVSVCHFFTLSISLSSTATELKKNIGMIAGSAMSIFLLILLLNAGSGLVRMIMSASSMRIENAELHIEGSFCSALSDSQNPHGTPPARCHISHAIVASSLGDRWWIECPQRSQNARDTKHLGYSLPSAQVVSWSRGSALNAQTQNTNTKNNGYVQYSADFACTALTGS
jgi:hypothetical protein